MARAKGRPTPKRGNLTEGAYGTILRAQVSAGLIREYAYEAVTLHLGHDLRYTPDYFVVDAEGFIEFHEVKGFRREDAMVKLRAAARAFPMFRFLLVEREGTGAYTFRRAEVTA